MRMISVLEPLGFVHASIITRFCNLCTFIALQREEIQLHPPEHGHKLPNQETLTRHLYKPTHSEEMPQ